MDDCQKSDPTKGYNTTVGYFFLPSPIAKDNKSKLYYRDPQKSPKRLKFFYKLSKLLEQNYAQDPGNHSMLNPDPQYDLESRTPKMVSYTTIG